MHEVINANVVCHNVQFAKDNWIRIRIIAKYSLLTCT